ncbi:hypothetical protein PHISP_06514 [Aspergillus sp. HF37]|nr:hypothetical protein PHISP_06514 [Aspergillus sp. HF37]
MSRKPNALLSLPTGGPLYTVASRPTRSHACTASTSLNASHRSGSLTPRRADLAQKCRHGSYFSGDSGLRRRPSLRSSREYTSATSGTANTRTPASTPLISTLQKSPLTLHPIHLNPLENTLRTLFLDVVEYIREKKLKEGVSSADLPQMELRFVGGWVRDKLLGVDSDDIDLGITDMGGQDFAKAIQEYLGVPGNLEKYGEIATRQKGPVSIHRVRANVQSSEHGGTYVASLFGRYIDIFTLRKAKRARKPSPKMTVGSAEEDAFRRDATINALFYNLRVSKVEDFTGKGIEDLKNRLIRTPSDPLQTLRADPVRILRLIRFGTERGYRLHDDTMRAMRYEKAADGIRDKGRIRYVSTEFDKILNGPNPRKALYFIDRLGLYSTLFTTDANGFLADTSSWPIAYDSLARLISPRVDDDKELKAVSRQVRGILIRNSLDTYYAWMITALAPWMVVPKHAVGGTFRRYPEGLPHPPWAVDVAKDSLYPTLRNLVVLSEVADRFRRVIEAKSSLLENRMGKTVDEIQEQVRLLVKSWGGNWRSCMIMAILQETMAGRDFEQVMREYDWFLQVYMR